MPTALYDPVPTFQEWFEQRGIDVYYNSDGVEVVDGAVKIRDVVTGEERMIPADTVVLAAGMTPRKEIPKLCSVLCYGRRLHRAKEDQRRRIYWLLERHGNLMR